MSVNAMTGIDAKKTINRVLEDMMTRVGIKVTPRQYRTASFPIRESFYWINWLYVDAQLEMERDLAGLVVADGSECSRPI